MSAFVWWELRASLLKSGGPMLDLRLFRRKLVAIGAAASWLSFMGMSSSRFMMPFYLQRVLEISPRDVGLLLIPPALVHGAAGAGERAAVGPFRLAVVDGFGAGAVDGGQLEHRQ